MGLESVVDLSSMGGFNPGAWLNMGWQISQVVIVGTVAMIAGYLFFYFLKYNKKVLLIERIGGEGLRFRFDRGQKDKKKKEFKLLRNRTIDCYYPDSSDEYPMGRASIIPMIVKNHSAVPINGVSENPHFVPGDINMQAYLATRLRRTHEMTQSHQKFWDKYGNQIIWGSTIIICFLIIVFILKRVDKALELGRSVATASVQASKNVM